MKDNKLDNKLDNNSLEDLYGTNSAKSGNNEEIKFKDNKDNLNNNENNNFNPDENNQFNSPDYNNEENKNNQESQKRIRIISLVDYRRKVLIIFISLLLAATFFAFFLGFYFSKLRNTNSHNNNQSTRSFVDTLPEMIQFLKENYYKDLSDDVIRANIISSIFNSANDRYTRIGLPAYPDLSLKAKGGFGISVQQFISSASDIRVIEVKSINKGTKAYENILTNSPNALYPGDIIAGFNINNEYYSFFNISNFTNDFNKVITTKLINLNPVDYLQFLILTKEQPNRELIVYSPTREKSLRLVTTEYKDYPETNNLYTSYKLLKQGDINNNYLGSDLNYNGLAKAGNVAYLQISEFVNDEKNGTSQEVAKALNVIDKFLVNANDELILDLRNNPGGDSVALNNIINMFIPKAKNYSDRKILYAFLKNALKNDPKDIKKAFFYNTDGIDNPKPYKIKILVNENTASAAEVLAVVLKEFLPNTKVYGTKTFGKDLYQSVRTGLFKSKEFPTGFNVRVTEGKWGYTKFNNPNEIHYITESGYEINPLNDSLKNKQISNNLFTSLIKNLNTTNFFSYDSVSKDNLTLVNFLNSYIIENNTNLGYLTNAELEKIKANTYFRTDMYFDLKIRDAINHILPLIDAMPSDKLGFAQIIKMIKYIYQYNTLDYFQFLDYDQALIKNRDQQLLKTIYEN